MPANEAARRRTSAHDGLNVFDALRPAIVTELAETDKVGSGEVGADEAHFGGNWKGNQGRTARRKKAVLGMPGGRGVRRSSARRQGRHTDKGGTKDGQGWEQGLYDQRGGCSSLIFHGCKHKAVSHSKMLSGEKFQPMCRGFRSFSKERVAGCRGAGRKEFVPYVKMEWRCNSRDQALFEPLAGYMPADLRIYHLPNRLASFKDQPAKIFGGL